MLSCDDALSLQRYPTTHPGKLLSYTEGFKSGWYDRFLGLSLLVSRTSPDTYYALGYMEGQISYDCHTSPLKQEGEVTCLKNLF